MWHSRSYPEFPKHTSCGLPYKKDASKSTLSFESMYPPSELRASRFIGNGPLTPKGCGGHEKPWGPHPERCPNTGQLIDLSSPAAFGRVKLIQACRYPGRITHKLYTTSNPLQHCFAKCDFWFLCETEPLKRINQKNLKKNIHHTWHDFPPPRYIPSKPIPGGLRSFLHTFLRGDFQSQGTGSFWSMGRMWGWFRIGLKVSYTKKVGETLFRKVLDSFGGWVLFVFSFRSVMNIFAYRSMRHLWWTWWKHTYIYIYYHHMF